MNVNIIFFGFISVLIIGFFILIGIGWFVYNLLLSNKNDIYSQEIHVSNENYDVQLEPMICLGDTCLTQNDLNLLILKSREVLLPDTDSQKEEINQLTTSIEDIRNSFKNSITKDDVKSGKIDMNINDMNLRTLHINDWKIYRDDNQNNLCFLNDTKDNIICIDANLNAIMKKI